MNPLFKRLKQWKDYLSYLIWRIKGKKIPVHPFYKRKRIIQLAKEYKCETFIETGTYTGWTIEYVHNFFEKILSVEIYKPLYELSNRRLQKYKNVKLFFGNSEVLLDDMIKEAKGTILFWLDGHYSGEGTGKSDKECPILNELKIILNGRRKNDVLLIDDARCFDGENDYPTLEQVKQLIKQINPNYMIVVKNDCVIAVPKN